MGTLALVELVRLEAVAAVALQELRASWPLTPVCQSAAFDELAQLFRELAVPALLLPAQLQMRDVLVDYLAAHPDLSDSTVGAQSQRDPGWLTLAEPSAVAAAAARHDLAAGEAFLALESP